MPTSADRKTILISGAHMTKALALARAFHAAGHTIVMCDSHRYAMAAHRFSNAVRAFETLPDIDDASYADALENVIVHRKIDVFVPVTSPAGSLRDSALVPRLSRYCHVLHIGPDLIAQVDDKHEFAATAREAGLRTPRTIKVASSEEVLRHDFASEKRRFILKSIAYDAVGRLDLTRLPMDDTAEMEAYVRSLPIRPDNPYVLQEFIEGDEYCTHGFFHDGALRVHICCASSPFQVNYDHVDKPAIREWVERFGTATHLTGQASFDFIEAADDGEVYAIECNPRTHSAITLLDGDARLATAYLDADCNQVIEPPPGTRATYWTAHEIARLFKAVPRADEMADRLSIIAKGRDAVLDPHDPLPFLALHHWHVPALLMRAMAEGRDWHRIDFNIGKLVQAGGD